jgi:hypothetical protein
MMDILKKNQKVLVKDQKKTELKIDEITHHYEMPIRALLKAIDKDGRPLIEHDLNPGIEYVAESTVYIDEVDLGKTVVVLFLNGNVKDPVITGIIQKPLPIGKPAELNYSNGIVIKSGRSKAVLDPAGTVLLQGDTVNTLAYGTANIKGSAVKIN